MRCDVAGEKKRRHAEQLVQSRKDGEAVVGQKLQAAGLGDRADRWEVVKRFVPCERWMQREEEETDEDRAGWQMAGGRWGRRGGGGGGGGREEPGGGSPPSPPPPPPPPRSALRHLPSAICHPRSAPAIAM